MKKQLVLADTDRKYITPLGMKFLEEFGENIELHIITDPEYFSSYFGNFKDVDVLITGETMPEIELEKHSIRNLYLLKENQEDCANDGDIYKYTSASLIYRKVTQEALPEVGSDISTDKKSKVVAVYSPCGGTGKTSIALGISSYLASSYRSVLYVDAEKINNFGYLIDNCESLSISTFVEAMQDDNPYEALKKDISKVNFEYLPPVIKSLSSFGAEVDIYQKFISGAKLSNDYDIIVVDMDSVFDEYKAGILAMADNVLIVANDTRVCKASMDNLVQNMAFANDKKFKIICNRVVSNETTYLDGFTINAYIEYVDGMDEYSAEKIGQLNSIKRASYLIV